MKRKSLLFLLLFALIAPWTAMGQSTLTVHENGTATNNTVPMYVYYWDSYTRAQTVFPASELEEMVGGTINSITFYTTSYNIPYTSVATFDVYLAEVGSESISSFIDRDAATTVMSGATAEFVSDGNGGGTVTLTLSTPYVYGGGNLLFGCDNNTDAGYKSINFYGETVNGASVSGYTYTAGETINPTQRNFLPMTTFGYTPGAGVSCAKPTDLVMNYDGGNSATFTWSGTASNYDIEVNGVELPNNPISGTSYTMAVEPNTTYSVKVRANCGGGDVSYWASFPSFTTPCAAFTLPYAYGFEDPDDLNCWMVVGSTSAYTGITGADDAAEGSYDFRFHYSERSAYLISPVFTGTENGLNVSFQYMNYTATTSYTEQFQVGYTTNAGETDPANFTYGDVIYGENSWNTYEDIFPANTKRIAIKYIYTDAFYLRLDDFFFEAPATCPAPKNLAYSDVTGRTVKLSWTERGEARDWQICLNGDENNLVPADENPFTLTGLTPETTYTAKVRSYCSSEDQSGWSNEVTFTTDVACPAPEVSVSDITPVSANISWTGSASSYSFRYKEIDASQYAIVILRTDDVWGDGTGYQLLLDADATAYGTTIPTSGGLTSGGDVSDEVYAEFEYKIPMNADGALATTNMVMNRSVSILIPAGTYDWCITNPTPGDRMWIASGNGTIGGRYDDYVFEAGKCYEFYTYDDPNSTNDATDLNISEFGGTDNGWSTPITVTSPYPFTGLDDATGYEVQVQAVCGGQDGSSAWVSAYFATLSNCEVPTDLTVTDINAQSVTLNWMGYQDGFQVRYRTPEHTSATSNSFFEDFENNTTLDGWTVIRNDEGTDYTDWHVVNSENLFSSGPIPAHSGSYVVMGRSWNSSAYNVDNWLITPQVVLNGTLSYWVYDDGQYHENCDVYVSTTTTDINAFTMLADPESATSEWTERTVDLSSFNGQLGYIAFRLNDYDQDFLFIDDVLIGNIETVPASDWEYATTDQLFFNTSENGLLEPDTDYEWQVQGENRDCGEDGYTEWSELSTFHTAMACQLPTNLKATDIEATAATLTWDGVQEDYNVRYRTAGFDGYYVNEDWDGEVGDWEGYNWGSNTSLYYEDETYTNIIFMMVALDGSATDQYLFSPDLRVGAAGNTLTFNYAAYDSEYTEHFEVAFYCGEEDAEDIVWDVVETNDTLWQTYQTVIPEGAQYMTIYYEDGYALLLDNFLCYNADDIVAAGEWIETLTGVNSPVTIEGLDPETYYEWNVQGNSEICPELDWVVDEFRTLEQTTALQTVVLNEGWNWFSTNVVITLDELKAALVEALPETAITIKGKTSSTKYVVRTHRWNGTLDWDITSMYKIEVVANCEIALEGMPMDPAQYPITIAPNTANWIGYPVAETLTLGQAFANFDAYAVNGDVIQGKGGSARYNRGTWRPNGLTALEPGQGYIFVPATTVTGERTLVYPAGASKAAQNSTSTSNVFKKDVTLRVPANLTTMIQSLTMPQAEKTVAKQVKSNEDCKSIYNVIKK